MKRAVVIVFVLSATWPAVAACPKLVDPVCAVDTSRYLKTFNNKCEALRAGGKYLHEGACFAEFCTHLCIAHGIYGRGVFLVARNFTTTSVGPKKTLPSM